MKRDVVFRIVMVSKFEKKVGRWLFEIWSALYLYDDVERVCDGLQE